MNVTLIYRFPLAKQCLLWSIYNQLVIFFQDMQFVHSDRKSSPRVSTFGIVPAKWLDFIYRGKLHVLSFSLSFDGMDTTVSVLKYVDWLRNSLIHISMTIGCTANQGWLSETTKAYGYVHYVDVDNSELVRNDLHSACNYSGNFGYSLSASKVTT